MVGLFISLALASASPAAEPPLMPKSECPQIFGDDEAREANRSRRDARIVDVVETDKGREIVHTVARWGTPGSARLGGLRFVGSVDPGDDGRPAWQRRTARVQVEGPCAAGTYALVVDDAIGARARVVAILDDSVLLEVNDRLVKLGESRDDLRMVWRSRFAISVNGGGGSSSSKSSVTPRTRSKVATPATKKDDNSTAAQRLLERRERAKARAAKKNK